MTEMQLAKAACRLMSGADHKPVPREPLQAIGDGALRARKSGERTPSPAEPAGLDCQLASRHHQEKTARKQAKAA